MNEIAEKRLASLNCDFLSGFAFKSADYTDNGIPLIKIGNIQNKIVTIENNGTCVSQHTLDDRLTKYYLSNNDVLIAMTGQGSVGRVGKLKLKASDSALLNQRVGKFICDEINLSQDYLYYILTSEKYQDFLFNAGAGSGQPNLSPDLILETEIPWFEYEEQKSIASVLSSLDNKIDLLHRQNKTLEAMAETLFRQWFVERAGDWEEGKIEDLFILQRGFDLPLQHRIAGTYPIFASSGFSGYHSEYKVKAPGITTGRSGVLGNVFLVLEDFWPLNTSLYIKEFKRATPLYAYYILKNLDLNTYNAGSAVPTLNRNHVHEASILIPPDSLVKRFESIASLLFRKIHHNDNQIKQVEKIRDGLLPKLMSGEVRVVI